MRAERNNYETPEHFLPNSREGPVAPGHHDSTVWHFTTNRITYYFITKNFNKLKSINNSVCMLNASLLGQHSALKSVQVRRHRIPRHHQLSLLDIVDILIQDHSCLILLP